MTLDEILEYLNEINRLDPSVLPALIGHRVTCNQALADHPTAQVGKRDDGTYEIGLLGLLNGMYGIDENGWGYICAVAEKDNPNGPISEFKRTPDAK